MIITDQIYVLDKEGNKVPYQAGQSISAVKQKFEQIDPNPSGTTSIIIKDEIYSYVCALDDTISTSFEFDIQDLSIDENTSVIFEFKLILNEVTSFTLPVNLNWENSLEPVFDRPGVYFMCFRTDDQGATWLGAYQGFWSV